MNPSSWKASWTDLKTYRDKEVLSFIPIPVYSHREQKKMLTDVYCGLNIKLIILVNYFNDNQL